MADQKLNLTREQLATFLKNFEQIKQFENLFAVVDEVARVSDTTGITIQAGNADAAANEALAQLSRLAQIVDLLASAPIVENNNSVATDYVDLNEQSPLPADKPGRMYWNRDDGTVDVDQYGDAVLQVGQELQYYAKNTSGGLVTNGTPVMFTGTVGASSKLTFGRAVANGSVPSEYMMGVATQDIANNEFGYVTNFGIVRGLNTTGSPYGQVWADGDLLYFNSSSPGTWTKFQPPAPGINVPVAVVLNAAPGGAGSIFVRMTVAEALIRLQDVYINGLGPLAGQVLIYDATQSRWENNRLTQGANIVITNADGSITIATTGASGSFTAASGETITVSNGIITSIV
jgi:hypothetical protein